MNRSQDIAAAVPSVDALGPDLPPGSSSPNPAGASYETSVPVPVAADAQPTASSLEPARKSRSAKKPSSAKQLNSPPPKMPGKKSATAAAVSEVTVACTKDDKPVLAPLSALTGKLVLLKPEEIVVWAGSIQRTELLDDEAYQEVRASVELAQINTVHVLVRRISKVMPGGATYELIDGQLRLRACRELKLKVQAIVVDAGQLDDASAMRHMLNSNHGRQPHSPLDIGIWANRLLDQGIFPTARALAVTSQINESDLSKARSLALLPAEVIAAFTGTKGLQYRFSIALSKTLESDRDGLIARAMHVLLENEKAGFVMTATEVYQQLLEPKPEAEKSTRERSKCEDCEEPSSAALAMASEHSIMTFVPMAQGASPSEKVPVDPTPPHENRSEAAARNQLHLDLETPMPTDGNAETEVGREMYDEQPATTVQRPEKAALLATLPRSLPSSAEPIITYEEEDVGWVYDDANSATCAFITVRQRGQVYRTWLNEGLVKLLSGWDGDDSTGGLSA